MITLPFVADYSATDFSKRASQVLDMAGHGAVRVRRRNEMFVVLRERQLNDIVEDARDPRRCGAAVRVALPGLRIARYAVRGQGRHLNRFRG